MERAVKTSTGQRVFGGSPASTLALLKAAWSLAVGEDLARRTEVVAFDNGTLRVRVPDPRWRKELHRVRREILKRLYQTAGPLTPRRLGFLDAAPDWSPETKPATEPVPPIPEPAPISPLLVQAAGIIPDPDLRARFLEVAARYLGRPQRAGSGSS